MVEPNKIGKEKSAPPESKARSFKCREMAQASIYQKTHHRQDTKETDQCSITKIIDQKTGKKKKAEQYRNHNSNDKSEQHSKIN